MESFRRRKAICRPRAARLGWWLAIPAVTLLLQACEQPTGPAFEDVPPPESPAITAPPGVVRLTTGPLQVAAPARPGTGTVSLSTGAMPAGDIAREPARHTISTAPVPTSPVPSSGHVGEAAISTPGTDISALTGAGTVRAQSVGSADIEVTKTASAPQVKVGEIFTYTMTVRNNGPDAATTVTSNDVLPASVTFAGFVSLDGPAGAACLQNAATVDCTALTLQPGQELVLVFRVTAASPGTATNTATGGSAVDDPVPGNNSGTAVTEILALEADIEVTKTSSVPQVKVGEVFTYTMTVRNNGPDAATTVTTNDVLPASVTFAGFVSLDGPPGAACIYNAGTLDCTALLLQPGQELVLVFTVTAVAPGTATNTATGGSAVDDPVPGNNSGSAVTEILPLETDIEVTKTSSAPEVILGQDFTYTMTVRNNGPDAASTVTMEDVLPASVTFVSFVSLTGPGGVACVYSSGVVNCTAATLQPGEQFVLVVTVRATSLGLVTNTATAGSATDDPVAGNNTASAETLLIGEGCGIGFWKNWPEAWAATGYAPAQTVGSVFASSGRAGLTLQQALALMGGNGMQGARDILLRAAVAALLSAAHPDVEYPITAMEVLAQVNAAFADGKRGSMLGLAEILDVYNNLGCPLP